MSEQATVKIGLKFSLDDEVGGCFFSLFGSAARCQLFKFDSISTLSNLIFDVIGLTKTSQIYGKITSFSFK